MKIVADQQIPHVAQEFSKFAQVTLCHGREITSERIRDADVLLVRSITTINENLLADSQVKFVATATSGQDHVDLNYLQSKNIGFAHAKGSNAKSVAEYVLSSLFVLADRYAMKLKGKTVGIIGYGEVGSRVAEMFETLDIKTIINDPPRKDKSGDKKYRDIQEIFSADIITLHIPLTKNGIYPTQNLVDEKFLSQLKDNVILLNTARGGIIHEAALKKHLAWHRNMKVVLDVWEDEPNIDVALLTQSDIGTAHIAGYSVDGRLRTTEMILKSFVDFFKLDHLWDPSLKLPDVQNLELPLGSVLEDQDAIQMAVLASYDVRSDSASLKQLSAINMEQRGQYFDELREKYPVRREFSATILHCHKGRERLVAKWKQLGFKVKISS